MPRRPAILHSAALLGWLVGAPAIAGIFIVINTNDSGGGSLRQAILGANATPAGGTILFSIPGSGVHTISPTSALPTITSQVTIDAGPQAIELSGASTPDGTNGLHLTAGNSTIRGLTINRFRPILFGSGGDAIVLETGGGNAVYDCRIGTNPAGTVEFGNGGIGISVLNSANNVIGGVSTLPAAPLPNLVSGGFLGVFISGSTSNFNQVVGNRIGTDVGGNLDFGNTGDGVFVLGGAGNEIRQNLISGNNASGISLRDATYSLLQDNLIGTNAAGTSSLSNVLDGIEISGGSFNAVRDNTVAANGRNGVFLHASATANHVWRNLIGTNSAGAPGLGNVNSGIDVSFASGNRIGTFGGLAGDPTDRNVIAGNGSNGVRVGTFASGNLIVGNWIGFDPGGNPMGNLGDGVEITGGATGNQVGGTILYEYNFIGANAGNGVLITDATSTGNHVSGNFIGLSPAFEPAGNGGHGVSLEAGASGNEIGGIGVDQPNRIAHNSGSGVFVEGGTGNEILNRIFGNGGLGIDLAPAGVTDNDAGDGDSGPNGLQNFPTLLSQAPTGGPERTITLTLESAPNASYRIDLFNSTECDTSGNGEGADRIGSATVVTDSSGTASLSLNALVSMPASLTATATDPAGNTSEFSPCLLVSTSYFTTAPCRLLDTRNPDGPFGGPALSPGVARDFGLNPQCGIPASALALAVNVTVTAPSAAGHLTVYSGFEVPPTSTLNYQAGQTRANNAVVPLRAGGDFRIRSVQPSGTVHVIVDVTGYFE